MGSPIVVGVKEFTRTGHPRLTPSLFREQGLWKLHMQLTRVSFFKVDASNRASFACALRVCPGVACSMQKQEPLHSLEKNADGASELALGLESSQGSRQALPYPPLLPGLHGFPSLTSGLLGAHLLRSSLPSLGSPHCSSRPTGRRQCLIIQCPAATGCSQVIRQAPAIHTQSRSQNTLSW